MKSRGREKSYTRKIGFDCTALMKKAVEEYAKEEGVSEGVVGRKAIFEYLKSKGKILANKKYI